VPIGSLAILLDSRRCKRWAECRSRGAPAKGFNCHRYAWEDRMLLFPLQCV